MICIYHQKMNCLWYAVAMEEERVLATGWASDEQEVLGLMLGNMPYNASFKVAEKPSQLSEKVLKTMRSMVAGEDVAFSGFKFEMAHLSKYSQRVLNVLARVPIGYVTTYGALAKAAGGGPRAVGRVMATNPFPPLIPCHRVVRSDFHLGGFGGGGGVEMKWAMLQREDRGFKQPTKMNVNGAVLSLFPVCFVRKD